MDRIMVGRCLMFIKPEWLGYRVVEKLWCYVKPFRCNTGTWRTDGRTDRRQTELAVQARDKKRQFSPRCKGLGPSSLQVTRIWFFCRSGLKVHPLPQNFTFLEGVSPNFRENRSRLKRHKLARNNAQWRGHRGCLGGLNPPPLSSGATHKICAESMRKYWGTPPPIMSYLQIRLSLRHNRSKWNFHVNSVAFARHVVQPLCHERVFLYVYAMFMSIYPFVSSWPLRKQQNRTWTPFLSLTALEQFTK